MNKEHSLEEDACHGTKERPIAIMKFEAGEGTAYPDGFFVQRHWHRGIEVLKILEGSYTVELSLENILLGEGDFCVINSEELHQIKGNEQKTRHEVIIFQPEILGFLYEDEFQKSVIEPLVTMQSFIAHVITKETASYKKIETVYNKILETGISREEGWYYDAKIGLLKLVSLLEKDGLLMPPAKVQKAAEKEKIDRYKRMVSYMEENYMNKVTLKELAVIAGCNPQHLCHFFKEIAGVPPMRHLIRYRIEKAGELLENSTKTVLEISLDCGFDNVSYFIRQFKKITGTTPGEYRKKQGKQEEDLLWER